MQEFDFILNVQGDEPFVDLSDLRKLQELFEKSQCELGTMVYRSNDRHDFTNPNVVKAVIDQKGHALYFSRAPIPHDRDQTGNVSFLQHIGVYAFRRHSLMTFCKLPPSSLELREKLEQLRALENGMKILAVSAQHKSLGIDTPEDLEAARAKY